MFALRVALRRRLCAMALHHVHARTAVPLHHLPHHLPHHLAAIAGALVPGLPGGGGLARRAMIVRRIGGRDRGLQSRLAMLVRRRGGLGRRGGGNDQDGRREEGERDEAGHGHLS